jgi:hypothetical protein
MLGGTAEEKLCWCRPTLFPKQSAIRIDPQSEGWIADQPEFE